MVASTLRRQTPSAVVLCAILFLAAHRVEGQAGQYGNVDFANSGAAAAQPAFRRGMALLHNFQYPEALRAFREAQQIDSSFAMAYWGEAMTYNHGIWREQDSVAARTLLARVSAAAIEKLGNATARERAYLDAVQLLYAARGSKESRDTAYALAMQRLATRYPDDIEAQLFQSLALLSLVPRTDSTYLRAAAIAERVMRDHPDHPGALHYVIHAYDDPGHAKRGLGAAQAYAKVAPDAPHAQHMTSHIFIALGMWDDVVAANEAAIKTAGFTPACGHPALWLHYAYLQQGRRADARRMMGACYEGATRSMPRAGGFAEMRLQYLVDVEPSEDSIVRRTVTLARPSAVGFTQIYGSAYDALRRGDTTHVVIWLDSLAQARQAFETTPMARQMPEMGTAMNVVVDELRAMLLLRTGKPNEAIRLLRRAAAQDDEMPFAFGPPAIEKPPHELLAEMLLSLGRAADAQKEFELALARTPGRSLTLLGLARASRAAGDTATAERAAAQWLSNMRRADTPVSRAEVSGRP
jgi:tetratricopeptide (TPR) repeat protein